MLQIEIKVLPLIINTRQKGIIDVVWTDGRVVSWIR